MRCLGMSGDDWKLPLWTMEGSSLKENIRWQESIQTPFGLDLSNFQYFSKIALPLAQPSVIIWGMYFPPLKSKLTIFFCRACLFLGPESLAKVQSNKTILFIGKVIKITEQALCPCDSHILPAPRTNPQGLADKNP